MIARNVIYIEFANSSRADSARRSTSPRGTLAPTKKFTDTSTAFPARGSAEMRQHTAAAREMWARFDASQRQRYSVAQRPTLLQKLARFCAQYV